MSDTKPIRFTVRGGWPGKSGSTAYLCPTRAQAIAVLRAFRKENYTGIAISDADGAPLTEADLIGPQGETAAEPDAVGDPTTAG